MRILITAGNTQTPIDRVRCITNIFTGKTGAAIALEAYRRGHAVTLATSHPEVLESPPSDANRWVCNSYRTFDELESLMAKHISHGGMEGVVHCAAVSDYHAAGVFSSAPGTVFDADTGTWSAVAGTPTLFDRNAGKVKSDCPELWLRLVRAPKLVDKIRSEWHFAGVLVKFKLEVGVTEADLQAIAERSRRQSDADLMVANTLEGAAEWALIGNEAGYQKVTRAELPATLLNAIEGIRKH